MVNLLETCDTLVSYSDNKSFEHSTASSEERGIPLAFSNADGDLLPNRASTFTYDDPLRTMAACSLVLSPSFEFNIRDLA